VSTPVPVPAAAAKIESSNVEVVQEIAQEIAQELTQMPAELAFGTASASMVFATPCTDRGPMSRLDCGR
jgi:actin-like ATPase involved in cell morphogenesis